MFCLFAFELGTKLFKYLQIIIFEQDFLHKQQFVYCLAKIQSRSLGCFSINLVCKKKQGSLCEFQLRFGI